VYVRRFVQDCFRCTCIILEQANQHSVECTDVNNLNTGLNAKLQCCYIAKALGSNYDEELLVLNCKMLG